MQRLMLGTIPGPVLDTVLGTVEDTAQGMVLGGIPGTVEDTVLGMVSGYGAEYSA